MNPICKCLKKYGHKKATLILCRKLSLLPLHAMNVDEINWSLAPSVYALRAVFRNTAKRNKGKALLGIANPLPNPQPLPNAQLELQGVEQYFEPNYKWIFYGQDAKFNNIYSLIYQMRLTYISHVMAYLRLNIHSIHHYNFQETKSYS